MLELIRRAARASGETKWDEIASHAVAFRVDNVAEYVHRYKQEWRDVRSAIPNVAPLAPVMWFEYAGRAIGEPATGPYACLLTVDYDREAGHARKWVGLDVPQEWRWILRAAYYYSTTEPYGVMASDWIYFMPLSNDGGVLGMQAMPCPPGPATPSGWVPNEEDRDVLHEEILVALVAMCFAHCKGARVEQEPISRQVRRAAERTGQPLVRYHTLDIVPSTRVLRTEGQAEQQGLARALHICRGHFATYSAERPLFGKFAGTFYIPMHVRGRAESGVVVKDYRSHVAAQLVAADGITAAHAGQEG